MLRNQRRRQDRMVNETIIEKIRKFVEEECNKPMSKYGKFPYEFHFVPMVDLAKKLAVNKNADLEIVELAAWLHDIGSIIYGRENHHITGAKIAEDELKKFNYPEEKIKKIKHCIIAHRGSNDIQPETLEAEIIMEADAMSNFENIAGIFMAAFIYENKNQREAKISVREKLQRKWNQLSLEGKAIIKPKYDAVMLLLK